MQRIEVRPSIFDDQLGYRFSTWYQEAEFNRQEEVGQRSRRSSITAKERMDPIHPPHHIRRQMNGRSVPLVIDVVTHLGDQNLHLACLRRLVI
jgi:hypothetical protein